jgi:hypothetical protein
MPYIDFNERSTIPSPFFLYPFFPYLISELELNSVLPFKWRDIWTLDEQIHPTFVPESQRLGHMQGKNITRIYGSLKNDDDKFNKHQSVKFST